MRRRHRRIHHALWRVLVLLLPLIVVAALAGRRTGPLEVPAIQIAPPS